jgi:hypothetical protein
MVCEHKSYGEKAWLPYEYRGKLRGLKAHPVCSKCGLVKNVSSERPKSLGHYLNILGQLAIAYSISLVQIRLISRELVCLGDSYGFCRHQQDEVFKEIVQKYAKVPERSIISAL